MNLVLDDAVEVKQPTKTDPETKRRDLGKNMVPDSTFTRLTFPKVRYC